MVIIIADETTWEGNVDALLCVVSNVDREDINILR